MNTATAPTESFAQTNVRALPTLGSIALVVLLGDYFFWRTEPGVSLGIFALLLGILIVVLRSGSLQPMRLPAALLLASCAQPAVEISLSNLIVLTVLLVALTGAAYFHSLPNVASRLIESALSLIKAPARWFNFGKAVLDCPLAASTSTMVAGDSVARLLRVILPGAALCGVFAIVLSSGNAMLGRLFTHLATQITDWLLGFDFSPARFVFWAVYATLALGMFWHGVVRKAARPWTQSEYPQKPAQH